MKFSEVVFENTVIGKSLVSPTHRVFFGNKFGDASQLQRLFPDQKLLFAKQVHGNHVAKAPAIEPADGQWTDEANVGVGIYTADCLPIMMCAENSGRVVALHAGWRGLASEIILKSRDIFDFKKDGVNVFIGPHIQNYEVHLDVAEKLIRAGAKTTAHADPAKVYVDLTELARSQFLKAGINSDRFHADLDNTFDDQRYFSYRGGAERRGRNISFVVKFR